MKKARARLSLTSLQPHLTNSTRVQFNNSI
nr:MAG TPA: hypothetical protein [Caudoviricetes sp.]DAS79448.1 MAG TPA: hypothetical protein [Herelleviridae sp.]